VLREIAGDGALFFSSGDPFGLARCLEVIFANVELRRRVGAAAKKNAERLSWTKAAAEVEALFAKSIEQ
jgi:glycosyltransferase involved in cell wall biosynthesis